MSKRLSDLQARVLAALADGQSSSAVGVEPRPARPQTPKPPSMPMHWPVM
jgi:hypothetical protein